MDLNLVPIVGVLAFALAGAAMIMAGLRAGANGMDARLALVEPHFKKVTAAAERERALPDGNLFKVQTSLAVKPEQRTVVRLLGRWGLSPKRALLVFSALRTLLAVGFGALALIYVGRVPAAAEARFLPFLAMLVAAMVGWLLPGIFLARKASSHVKLVAAGMPDALELLVVCVEAGLSLEDGIDRVVVELAHSQPEVAEELALTSADLKILPSRDQALANFAERVGIPSVRSVINTLSQTLRYGTPLVQSLRVVAAEMRNESLIKLEEQANRLPALMTIPVILFLMPTIFLVVGGPAALKLIDSFASR